MRRAELSSPHFRFGLLAEFLRRDEITLHVVADGFVERCHRARVPGARSFATSAWVKYWYLPRSTSGMSMNSICGGRPSAAKMARVRVSHVFAWPLPRL